MSDLLYAGKTRQEIAGYTNTFLCGVLFLRRNKYGELIRDTGLPPHVEVDDNGMRKISNPVPFSEMFFSVQASKGLNKEQVAERWDRYLDLNPKLKAKWLDQQKRRNERRRS